MTDDHTLAGRYRLAGLIGAGGMGAVYRATDLRLGRTVAVKVLPGSLADHEPAGVARFEREARAAARVSHPGVVRVFDAGADGGTRFIVMEHVHGDSLEAIVRGEAPLEPARAARIGRHVADALAAAHAAGIVHRDVKPANVIVADDGTVRVLDFGVAWILERTALTQTSALLGTVAYMSPEQALGEAADARSDVYSLGCVLYAMLTGAPPFTAEAAPAILLAHAHSEPRPPSLCNGRVWPGLDALVLEMLAKSPAARPQTAACVRERLDQELGSVRAGRQLPVVVAPAPAPARPPPRGGRGRRATAAGLAVLAVAGAVTVLVIGQDPRSRRVPPRPGTPAAARQRPHTTATRVSGSPPAAGAGATSQPAVGAGATSQPALITTGGPAPAGNGAQQADGNGAQQADGNGAQQADGNGAQQADGNGAQQAGGNGAQQAGGDGAQQAGGDAGQPAGHHDQPQGQAKQGGDSGSPGDGGSGGD